MSLKTKSQDKGVLDQPLFQYSARRRLERVGVVDVGSNSVRLVIFDGAARSPAYFFNEKILCGLGLGLMQTGRLNLEGRVRALKALKRFVLLAKGMRTGPLFGVATAAVREAEDGAAFCREVAQETGLHLTIASGEDEARLSAQGVLLGWPGAHGLMCDIGGASLEMASIAKGEIGQLMTTPLGPLTLAAIEDKEDRAREISSQIKRLRARFDQQSTTLFLVGGSWRVIARLDMERRSYPLKVLHEYEITPEQMRDTTDWIAGKSVEEMRALSGSSIERLQLVPIAAEVLRQLIAELQPAKIAISSYGIREGLLYEQMPKRLRKRDPLIEACIHMERASARNPGFGKALYAFLSPVFKGEGKARKRLIHAACLLHDVTWRAHPDYRAQVCFDNATRSNLGGLDHAGRVFLATALLHRYKGAKSSVGFGDVIELLSEEDRKAAEILGKALRFGAMLSGSSPGLMGSLRHRKKKKILELVLSGDSQDLFGEVVATRFESLARSLGARPKLRLE